jgi:uncharacterized protein YuzE
MVQLAAQLTKLPMTKLTTDYDVEADVLYLSFGTPERATDSELLESGIIVRRSGKAIVGLTILDASTRGTNVQPHGNGKKAARRRSPSRRASKSI